MATAPHIRDLNLPDWHEVPPGATIPVGTDVIATWPTGPLVSWRTAMPFPPRRRDRNARYFTPEPILDPHAAKTEGEAARLFRLAFPGGEWPGGDSFVSIGFRRIAADSLARNKEN